jgi:hypothetical protein
MAKILWSCCAPTFYNPVNSNQLASSLNLGSERPVNVCDVHESANCQVTSLSAVKRWSSQLPSSDWPLLFKPGKAPALCGWPRKACQFDKRNLPSCLSTPIFLKCRQPSEIPLPFPNPVYPRQFRSRTSVTPVRNPIDPRIPRNWDTPCRSPKIKSKQNKKRKDVCSSIDSSPAVGAAIGPSSRPPPAVNHDAKG